MNESMQEQLNRIEEKLDTLIALMNDTSLKKKAAKNSGIESKKVEMTDTIKKIYATYKARINNRSRLISKAEQKIKARLKEYSQKQLLQAIDNFSKDDWWMKNNAHRGVAWFFHSEDRVEQFLNLTPQRDFSKLELIHNDQPCKVMDRRIKIYAPWSGQWLDWNKNHPQYDKFVLKDRGKIIETGVKAYEAFVKFHEL